MLGLYLGSFIFNEKQVITKEILPKKAKVIVKNQTQQNTIKLPDFIIDDLKKARIKTKNLTKEDWHKFLSFYAFKHSNKIDKKSIESFIRNKDGKSLIHLIAAAGLIDNLEELIKLGYDINEEDEYGNTPLLLAMQNTNGSGDLIGVIKKMLKLGANLSINNNEQYVNDALSIALNKDYNYSVVKYLLENGLVLSKKHLYFLSKNKNKNFLYQFLDTLDINSYDNIEILDKLISFNANNEIISNVIQNYINLNPKLYSANPSKLNILHTASISKTISAQNIEKIINLGIDVNSKVTSSGFTALMYAVHNANINTIETLLKHGARFDIYDNLGRNIYDIMANSVNIDDKKQQKIIELFDKYSNKQ